WARRLPNYRNTKKDPLHLANWLTWSSSVTTSLTSNRKPFAARKWKARLWEARSCTKCAEGVFGAWRKHTRVLSEILQFLSRHRCRSRLGRIVIFRYRPASDLVVALVGAGSGAGDCTTTSRRRCFSAWFHCVAHRGSEPMELRQESDRTATANHHSLLSSSCRGFRFGCSVHAQFFETRLALPGCACFSCLLGGMRISQRDFIASQHVGQSRLHTNELSPSDPNRFDHRHLGNQFHHVSVCRNYCSSVERRGKTMATSRTRYCCRCRRVRRVCFW